MGIAAVLDKAGPALASGLILAILGAAATSALAWRDLLSTSTVRFGTIASELERLRTDLEAFRSPGGRFTSHDGDRHWARIDDIDRRLREQETRAPRLNPALEKAQDKMAEIEHRLIVAESRLERMAHEQDLLCSRIAACREDPKRAQR